MRKIFLSLSVAALAAATVAGGTAIAKHGPPHGKGKNKAAKQKKAKQNRNARQNNGAAKVWICHLADNNKYVAIRVPTNSAHFRTHAEDIVAGVPQDREEARRYCERQQPLTPRRGGAERETMLTNPANPGVTATLEVRTRLGQGQLCFRLTNLTGATDITSLTITRGTTTITLDVTGAETTESGCVSISRELAREIQKNPGAFTATAVVTTAGGPVTLTGTLARSDD